MTKYSIFKTISVIALGFLVAGCSPDSQDSGGNSGGVSTGVKLSGSIIDGYVAGAAVYVDTNGNKKLDISLGESFALTDEDGDFGDQNNKTYCTDNDETFCLSGNFKSNTTYTVRMEGGTDISTGLPFKGTMTAKVTTLSDGSLPVFYVTPITTLTTNMTSTQVDAFATTLGVTADDLNQDFMYLDSAATAAAGGDSTELSKKVKLAKVAVQLHKFAETVSESVRNEVEAKGGSSVAKEDKPDVAEIAYQKMAAKLASSSDISATLQTEAANIVTETMTDTKSAYEAKTGTTIPVADLNSGTGKNLGTALQSVVTTVDAAFKGVETSVAGGASDATAVENSLYGGMRVAQVVTNTAVTKDNAAADIDGLKQQIDPASGTYDATLAANFEKDTTDVDEVTTAVTTGANLTTTFTALANRPKITPETDKINGTTTIGGHWITSVRDDPTMADDYVSLLFQGTNTSRKGDLIACLTYHESTAKYNANDPMFKNAKLIGTWTYINDYQLTLTLNVSGTKQAGTLISKAIDTTANKWVFRVVVGDEDVGETRLDLSDQYSLQQTTITKAAVDFNCPVRGKYTTCPAGTTRSFSNYYGTQPAGLYCK